MLSKPFPSAPSAPLAHHVYSLYSGFSSRLHFPLQDPSELFEWALPQSFTLSLTSCGQLILLPSLVFHLSRSCIPHVRAVYCRHHQQHVVWWDQPGCLVTHLLLLINSLSIVLPLGLMLSYSGTSNSASSHPTAAPWVSFLLETVIGIGPCRFSCGDRICLRHLLLIWRFLGAATLSWASPLAH